MIELRDETVTYDPSGDAGRQRPRELALSAAWHGALTRSLVTIAGERINILFPGRWTHGFGPDFSDAMLEIEGDGLLTGAVEIHHRSSEWVEHGHHLDPRYNDVILHVVSRHDMPETRRADGRIVPVAVLTIPDEMLFRIDARLPGIWSKLGGTVCAESVTAAHPERILRALRKLGDDRLAARVTRFEGELAVSPPNDIQLEAIFDGFGYSENREAMRTLFLKLKHHGVIDSLASMNSGSRYHAALGRLLGFAGFLPLAPGDAHVAQVDPVQQGMIERDWMESGTLWHTASMSPMAWQRARTRPANHPVTRLKSLAALLANTRCDLLAITTESLRNGGNLVTHVRNLTTNDHTKALGDGRATGIVATVILPFAIAYARHIEDDALEESAIAAWDGLAVSETNRPAKRALAQVAGQSRLRGLGERGQQGLIHLDRDYCTPRRCFECPIAAEVIQVERAQPFARGTSP